MLIKLPKIFYLSAIGHKSFNIYVSFKVAQPKQDNNIGVDSLSQIIEPTKHIYLPNNLKKNT